MIQKYFSSTVTTLWLLSIIALLGSCATNSADIAQKKREKKIDEFILLANRNPEAAELQIRTHFVQSVEFPKTRGAVSPEEKKEVEEYLESRAKLVARIAKQHPSILKKHLIQQKTRTETDANLLMDIIQKDPEAAKEMLRVREKGLNIQASSVKNTTKSALRHRGLEKKEVSQLHKRPNQLLISIIDNDPQIAADLLKFSSKASQVINSSKKGEQIDNNFAHECDKIIISLYQKNSALAEQWLVMLFRGNTPDVLLKAAQKVLPTDPDADPDIKLLKSIELLCELSSLTPVNNSVSEENLKMIAKKLLTQMTYAHNEQQPSE